MPTLFRLRVSLISILALLLSDNNAVAFVSPSRSSSRPFSSVTTTSLSSAGQEDGNNINANPFTASEVREMDSLIMSLSLEPTDSSRRQRLASVFADELAKADCKRFADLFDQVLVIVGDRVQVEAKQKALARQQEEKDDVENIQDEKPEGQDDNDNHGDFMDMAKSPEERQLWALVDMMVQSKTLAKKRFGELGNRGTLQ